MLSYSAQAGVRLAASEINKAGGILGRQIQLVPGDDKSDPTMTVLEARRLVTQEKVDASLITEETPAPDEGAAEAAKGEMVAAEVQQDESTVSKIAHAVAPAIADDGDWHALLMPIRRTAVSLAQAGRLVIYRKGKIADPNDFRGVYRLGLPRQD